MKTSLAGIACFALFLILNLGVRGDAQFLDDSCKTSTLSQAGAWMAVLRNKTHIVCAGSLIHRQFVLTSAQCIEGQTALNVALGAKDLQHPVLEVGVKKANIHRSYSWESSLNDIALVMLSNKVNYTEEVRPICILLNATVQANADKIDKILNFRTFGWGIGTDRQISNYLTENRIGRLRRSYCGIRLDESSFCGRPSVEGFCGGDIGGPLSRSRQLEDKKEYSVQFGVVSSGVGKCGGTRIYTDVTRYADWIERSVRDNEDPEISLDIKIQRPKSPPSEDMLYSDCGKFYLTANIYGPDFMAKGVMITHRFVLTTAKNLTTDVSSLRVGVHGLSNFQEIAIDSVYKHPEFLKTDIALLKLSSELIPENIMKPICTLRRPPVEQSGPTLTILDFDRNGTKTIFKFPKVQKLSCPASLRVQIQPTEICFQTPSGIKQVFGIRGNVVSQRIVIPGYTTNYPLFGIVKYSEHGINLITDVTSHTDWIASVVSENSV